jgi:pantoate--beta-alanine ligase
VVSIFVNPAQFAPHEDLATYPRTLESDLGLLKNEMVEIPAEDERSIKRYPSAIFVPSVKDIYPAGITQEVSEQRGTFVQVKGLEEEMEGKSRPGFFRGVATVVLKLFNAVEVNDVVFSPVISLICIYSRHTLTSDKRIFNKRFYSGI